MNTEVKAVGLSFRHVTEKLERGDKVKLVPEPDNKFDPNALAIQTLDGAMLGYVGKKDKLRSKIRERALKEEVQLPVLVANYYEEGQDKLWESVEVGDLVQLWLTARSKKEEETTYKEIESFTGETVLWSEYHHSCIDLKGNELLGGSSYAKQFERDFDQESVAEKYAEKHGLNVDDVIEYWTSLGGVSADYGTSIHRALEHYSKSIKNFTHEESLPRIPHLREAVKQFLKVSNFTDCIAEPLITDVEMGMSGWIDNLRFIDEKTVRIEDFKTNTFKDRDYYSKWKPKLKLYKHQLDFYGTILENHGYKVLPHVIWHWHEGKWDKHTLSYSRVKNYLRKEL